MEIRNAWVSFHNKDGEVLFHNKIGNVIKLGDTISIQQLYPRIRSIEVFEGAKVEIPDCVQDAMKAVTHSISLQVLDEGPIRFEYVAHWVDRKGKRHAMDGGYQIRAGTGEGCLSTLFHKEIPWEIDPVTLEVEFKKPN